MKRACDVAFQSGASSLAVYILSGFLCDAAAQNQSITPVPDGGQVISAELGRTSGAARYKILYSLKAADRVATGLTVADLNKIIAGMEDQRVKVVNLMRRDLVPNLTATDVVVASSTDGGQAPAPASVPPPPKSPGPAAYGTCGSTDGQRVAIPDYVCFSMYGGTMATVPMCSIGAFAGYTPVYFGEACHAHDDCYGRAGASRSQCDSDFLSLLNATCDETLSGSAWTFGRKNCHNASSEYYHQVSTKGCDAFKSAQAAAGNTRANCD
jgi:hypothetical protein